jgi:nitrogen fixation protein NifB
MTSCSSFSGGNACQSADDSALAPRVADKVAAPLLLPQWAPPFRADASAGRPGNLQCNYCNRKFDCSNESRPGCHQRC